MPTRTLWELTEEWPHADEAGYNHEHCLRCQVRRWAVRQKIDLEQIYVNTPGVPDAMLALIERLGVPKDFNTKGFV